MLYLLELVLNSNWINNDDVMTKEMMPIIKEVAEETGAKLIDLHTPFDEKSYLSDDKVHPNDRGYVLLANVVAHAICSDCVIPELPEDYFLQIADFSQMDKTQSIISSGEMNVENMVDKQAETVSEMVFEKDCSIEMEMKDMLKLTAYSITSSGEVESPKSWKLKGRNSVDGSWRQVDSQKDIVFMKNETKIFNLNVASYKSHRAYKYYQLIFSENNGGDKLAVAEWQMFGTQDPLEKSLIDKEGGILSAQFTNTSAAEGPNQIIDKNASTKYCVSTTDGTCWFMYELPTNAVVRRYAFTSANDAAERDPVAWKLSASVDGEAWTVLDQRADQIFGGRYSTMEYEIENEEAYKYYKVEVTKIKNGDYFQLAEWQLFGEEDNSGFSDLKESKCDVYVNDGMLTIQSGSEDNGTYKILSLTGQEMFAGKLPAGGRVSQKLFSGIYLLYIDVLEGEFVNKVLVK